MISHEKNVEMMWTFRVEVVDGRYLCKISQSFGKKGEEERKGANNIYLQGSSFVAVDKYWSTFETTSTV